MGYDSDPGGIRVVGNRSVSVVLMSLMACGGTAPTPSMPEENVEGAPTIDIVALSEPAAFLGHHLMADIGRVERVAPPTADPLAWQPQAVEVAALVAFDVIVANGAGLEAWRSSAVLPETRLVDSSRDVQLLMHQEPEHAHPGADPHHHETPNPYTWLDPIGFARQAKTVAGALSAAAPEQVETLGKNRDTLIARLKTLHEQIMASSWATSDAAPFVCRGSVAELASAYFLRRYGKTATPLDACGDVTTLATASAGPATLLVDDGAEVAVPAGWTVVVWDPILTADGPSLNYFARMETNLTQLGAVPSAERAPSR